MVELLALYLLGVVLVAIALLATSAREANTVRALGLAVAILLWPLLPIYALLGHRIRRRKQKTAGRRTPRVR